jgi:hypothetical protein
LCSAATLGLWARAPFTVGRLRRCSGATAGAVGAGVVAAGGAGAGAGAGVVVPAPATLGAGAGGVVAAGALVVVGVVTVGTVVVTVGVVVVGVVLVGVVVVGVVTVGVVTVGVVTVGVVTVGVVCVDVGVVCVQPQVSVVVVGGGFVCDAACWMLTSGTPRMTLATATIRARLGRIENPFDRSSAGVPGLGRRPEAGRPTGGRFRFAVAPSAGRPCPAGQQGHRAPVCDSARAGDHDEGWSRLVAWQQRRSPTGRG